MDTITDRAAKRRRLFIKKTNDALVDRLLEDEHKNECSGLLSRALRARIARGTVINQVCRAMAAEAAGASKPVPAK